MERRPSRVKVTVKEPVAPRGGTSREAVLAKRATEELVRQLTEEMLFDGDGERHINLGVHAECDSNASSTQSSCAISDITAQRRALKHRESEVNMLEHRVRSMKKQEEEELMQLERQIFEQAEKQEARRRTLELALRGKICKTLEETTARHRRWDAFRKWKLYIGERTAGKRASRPTKETIQHESDAVKAVGGSQESALVTTSDSPSTRPPVSAHRLRGEGDLEGRLRRRGYPPSTTHGRWGGSHDSGSSAECTDCTAQEGMVRVARDGAVWGPCRCSNPFQHCVDPSQHCVDPSQHSVDPCRCARDRGQCSSCQSLRHPTVPTPRLSCEGPSFTTTVLSFVITREPSLPAFLVEHDRTVRRGMLLQDGDGSSLRQVNMMGGKGQLCQSCLGCAARRQVHSILAYFHALWGVRRAAIAVIADDNRREGERFTSVAIATMREAFGGLQAQAVTVCTPCEAAAIAVGAHVSLVVMVSDVCVTAAVYVRGEVHAVALHEVPASPHILDDALDAVDAVLSGCHPEVAHKALHAVVTVGSIDRWTQQELAHILQRTYGHGTIAKWFSRAQDVLAACGPAFDTASADLPWVTREMFRTLPINHCLDFLQ